MEIPSTNEMLLRFLSHEYVNISCTLVSVAGTNEFCDKNGIELGLTHTNLMNRCRSYPNLTSRPSVSTVTSSNGNIFPVTGPLRGENPSQRPVTRSFDVFFDLRLIIRLNKQSWGWWFETPSCPLWRHSIVSRYRSRLPYLVHRSVCRPDHPPGGPAKTEPATVLPGRDCGTVW